MKFIHGLTILLLAFPLFAYSAYHYDYKTGNSYSSYRSGDSTYVSGHNTRTGSSWNTTIDSNGNQHGQDSHGNYWNYNARTGSYYNSNGTTCYGKGTARTCN